MYEKFVQKHKENESLSTKTTHYLTKTNLFGFTTIFVRGGMYEDL